MLASYCGQGVVGFASLLIGLSVSSATHGQVRSMSDSPIVNEGAELELLFEAEFFTEGPSVAFDGTVLFVDLDFERGGTTIWRFEPRTDKTTRFRQLSGLGTGTAIDPEGNLLVAEVGAGGGRRIARINLKTGELAVVADSYDGKPIHGANDVIVDEIGNIYFTEYVYIGPDEVLHHEGSGVYRVDRNGTVHRVIRYAGRPNGIAISPDQTRLYVGANRFDALGSKAILWYELAPDGRVSLPPTVLAMLDPLDAPLPDGMAVDIDGNLYVALFSTRGQSGVAIYRPDGEQIGFVETPGAATNVTFGLGADARSLYITAGRGLYRLAVNRPGYHPAWRTPR